MVVDGSCVTRRDGADTWGEARGLLGLEEWQVEGEQEGPGSLEMDPPLCCFLRPILAPAPALRVCSQCLCSQVYPELSSRGLRGNLLQEAARGRLCLSNLPLR